MIAINELFMNAFSVGSASWYIFLLSFFSGVLVSFTPCIYPMIPITAGILNTQVTKSMFWNFILSSVYVLGMACVYSLLGYVSATTSILFGQWISNPIFVVFALAFFLYHAGTMFGFYELYIPSFLKNHASFEQKKSIMQIFIFGVMSGTFASPCLTPVLATLLSIVAKEGSGLIGFFALLFFSFGMGILLILIGTFSSTIHFLPQAGTWMNYIKKMFGFFILSVCVYFLQPFLSQFFLMIGYTVIFFSAFMYYVMHVRSHIIALFLSIIFALSTLILVGLIIKSL